MCLQTQLHGDSKPIDIEVCSLDEVAKGENSAYLTNVTISRETYDPKCELSLNFGSEYKLFKPTSYSGVHLVPIFLCGILLSVVFTVVWCIYKGPSKKKSESEELPTYAPTATDVTAPEKVQQGLPKRVTKTVAVKEPSDKSVPKPITELLAAKAETTNTTDGPKTTISMTDAALSEKTAISSTPVSVDEYMDYDEPTRQRMHRQDAREKYIKQLQKYGVQAVGKIRTIVSGSSSAQSEAEIAKRRKGIRDQYEVIPMLPINKSPVKEGKKSRKTSARNEVDASTKRLSIRRTRLNRRMKALW
uniref:Uncharacterized protein n=1 Tax=Ditylenchus dipsaci TaxID=166011 RepID=A0A915CV60_9BILA